MDRSRQQVATRELQLALDENAVSIAVCRWLEERGYDTTRILAGQPGFDITANHPSGEQWIIEAKGATSSRPGTARSGKIYGSNSTFQALASAFLTTVDWIGREELVGKRIGIAIPSTPWFDLHSAKIEKACSKLGISIFRVLDDHSVTFIEFIKA